MVKIRMHEDYVIEYPTNINGDLYELASVKYINNLTNWGCSRKKVGNLIECTLLNGVTLDLVDFSYVMTRVGGIVTGFTPFLVIDDLTSLVPNYIPNAFRTVNIGTEELPEYVTELKTWREWIKPNYIITEIQGKSWVKSYAGTDNAEAMDCNILWDIELLEPGVYLETVQPADVYQEDQ